MATQTFAWPTPTSPDNNDTTTELTLGVKFTCSVAGPCVGVRFWVPPTRPSGPSPAYVALWTADGAGAAAILAYKDFDWATIGPLGSYVEVLFDGVDPTLGADGGPPVTLTPGASYMAVTRTYERWGGSAGSWPVTVGVLTATSDNGWLKIGVPYGKPDLISGLGTNFNVSPIVTLAGVSGSASFVGGALQLSAVGRRAKAGAAAFAGGALTLAAAGTRAKSGAAAFAGGALTLAAVGTRARRGSAAFVGGRLVLTARGDGAATTVRPGTLTVREGASRLQARDGAAGLTIRER